MVNYTLGDGFKKMMEFEVKHTTGDICISTFGTLDYETRSSYEFPIIATDQGKKNTFMRTQHKNKSINLKRKCLAAIKHNIVEFVIALYRCGEGHHQQRQLTNQNALMRMGYSGLIFFFSVDRRLVLFISS